MVHLNSIVVALLFVVSTAPVRAQTEAPPPPAVAPPVVAPGPAPDPVALGYDRGAFAGLWVTPIATHQFQGAGLELGYRYRWLAALYRLGFLQNGYAPPNEPNPVFVLERTQRMFLELELDGQWRIRDRVTVALGGGAALLDDRVGIASTEGVTWTTKTKIRDRVRPVLSVTLVGPVFQSSVSAYVGTNPEVRLSFGICLGRHARR
jgi:hypothetical protein